MDAELPPSPSPGPRPVVGLEAPAAVLSVFAVAVLAIWWARPTPSPSASTVPTNLPAAAVAAGYLGPRACAECHPGEFVSFTTSGHASTLRRAPVGPLARWLDGRTEADPKRAGVDWTFALDDDGRLTIGRDVGGQVEHRKVDFLLGSGHRATTFLSLADGDAAVGKALEHRLTYFADGPHLGLTPGQASDEPAAGQTDAGFELPGGVVAECLGCHATATAFHGGRPSPREVDPTTLVPNVTCERCHGPGRNHVEVARRGGSGRVMAMPLGPGRTTAEGQVRACGRCHRTPEMMAPAQLDPSRPALARFPSVGLLRSACFTRGGGPSCTECHDPHARVAADTAVYEPVCRSCHTVKGPSACPGSPRSGCIGCHMPRRQVGHGLVFTDHWIRRPDAAAE